MTRAAIRACCGTPHMTRTLSAHAAGCRYAAPPRPSGGPYCIARGCRIIGAHAVADPRHTHDHPLWSHAYAFGPCTREV